FLVKAGRLPLPFTCCCSARCLGCCAVTAFVARRVTCADENGPRDFFPALGGEGTHRDCRASAHLHHACRLRAAAHHVLSGDQSFDVSIHEFESAVCDGDGTG